MGNEAESGSGPSFFPFLIPLFSFPSGLGAGHEKHDQAQPFFFLHRELAVEKKKHFFSGFPPPFSPLARQSG